jgi:phenylacetate-CoA ligase
MNYNKLVDAIKYATENSPFYKTWFANSGISPDDIKNITDLQKLPTVNKNDLFNQNEDFLCVSKSEIQEYVTTSGTLGDPVWIGLTENDLVRLGKNEAYSYELANLNHNDLIQLTTTLDKRFMAGLAYWLGARESKIGVIRTGPGIPELQWDTIRRMKSTVLVAVPSFLLKMIEFAEREGFDPNATTIKKAICIGEPVRNCDLTPNALALRIQEKWNIQLFGTYASTEMATAFTECAAGAGGHLNPNLIIAECLDDEGRPVAEGEPGEITVTTLGVEGMPLIRFRTGDVARMHTFACLCGRDTPRIGPVEGRKQQMIKYRGTTLYPPAIFDLLNGIEQIEAYLVELHQNDIGTDEIIVKVALKTALHDFEKELKDKFRAKLRVAPQIQFEEIEAINILKWPEGNRKPRLLIDFR